VSCAGHAVKTVQISRLYIVFPLCESVLCQRSNPTTRNPARGERSSGESDLDYAPFMSIVLLNIETELQSVFDWQAKGTRLTFPYLTLAIDTASYRRTVRILERSMVQRPVSLGTKLDCLFSRYHGGYLKRECDTRGSVYTLLNVQRACSLLCVTCIAHPLPYAPLRSSELLPCW
jgi:hypothetical protein